MKIRAVDNNGDIVFGKLNDYYENTLEGVALLIRDRLNLWLGTWFANTQSGVPYLQEALGKRQTHVINAFLQATIRETPNVVEIKSFFINMNKKGALSIVGQIETQFGTLQLNESLS